MTSSDLSEQRVLILEDDFLIADETAAIVRAAGATVIGPHAAEHAAFEDILYEVPTVAVLDIGLHGQPSFEFARTLRDIGVPFVFLTGYDADVVPQDLGDAPHLPKPIEPRRLVDTLERLVAE